MLYQLVAAAAAAINCGMLGVHHALRATGSNLKCACEKNGTAQLGVGDNQKKKFPVYSETEWMELLSFSQLFLNTRAAHIICHLTENTVQDTESGGPFCT